MIRVPLHAKSIRPTSEPLRRLEPVTFGVPFPRGLAASDHGWTLVSEGGIASAAQTRVLQRWPDDSIRWLLVDAGVTLDASKDTPLELVSQKLIPAQLKGVSVFAMGDEVRVETGAATFYLSRRGAYPFEQVIVDGERLLAPEDTGLIVTTADGGRCSVTTKAIRVEERGPLRATVVIEGEIRAPGDREGLLLKTRADFYADSGVVRLQVAIANPRRAIHPSGFWDLGDPGSVFLKSVELRLAFASPMTSAGCSPEIGAPWTPLGPFRIHQDSSGGERWDSSNHINHERTVPLRFRGYELSATHSDTTHGLRATPIGAASAGSQQVAVTLPHFWQNFPKALAIGDGRVSIDLFPETGYPHELQGGERKTHECFVSFAPDGVTSQPLEWARSRVLVTVDPEWAVQSAAIPFLSALTPAHVRLIDQAIEGEQSFERKREVIDEYGWRHFGEIYGDHEAVRCDAASPLVSHYNNQYDAVAGFACAFLRSGDPRWWTQMCELASHVADIDIYHTDRDKSAYNGGMFWHTYHYGDADTATHRTYPFKGKGRTFGGGPSADHCYTTGLMLHHFLTGDAESRDAVIGLARYIVNLDDGSKTIFRWIDRGPTGRASMSAGPDYCGPGRGPANAVNALVDGHRLSGEIVFLDKAEELIRRVIHPRDDIASRRLDVPEQRWFYTMFLQSLGKYLQYKAEIGQLDEMYAYGAASLLHYARWMAVNEYPYLDKPERLEYPTETWAAQDIRKSDALYLAALHAGDEERAIFEEKGKFFYQYAVDTLAKMPTRSLARPVVVLLSSGFMAPWVASSLALSLSKGARLPAAACPVPDDEPQQFVPQRARAKQRVMVGMASCAVLCLLIVLITVIGL